MSFPKDPDLMALLRQALAANLTESTLSGGGILETNDVVLGIVPVQVRGLFYFGLNLLNSEECEACGELLDPLAVFCTSMLQMYIPAIAEYDDYKICENWEVVGFDLTNTEQAEENDVGHISSYIH